MSAVLPRPQADTLYAADDGMVALAHGDVERTVALTRQRIDESGEEAIRRLDTSPTDGDAA